MRANANREGESPPKCERRCVRVLVVGAPEVGAYVRRGLEKRGCECSLARSPEEAADLIRRKNFDLVVCTEPLDRDDPLVALLENTGASAICYQPGEPTNCWTRILHHGISCRDQSPLLPAEFVECVDKLVDEIASEEARAARRMAS